MGEADAGWTAEGSRASPSVRSGAPAYSARRHRRLPAVLRWRVAHHEADSTRSLARQGAVSFGWSIDRAVSIAAIAFSANRFANRSEK